ncbi:MAG: ABC transporter permease subunit [Planctomycetota bacterium]|jgi:ABC-type transport system involved in multi-copper enzyme maturation permease subunit
MTTALTSTFSNSFDPARLFGPIFDKELRVSSRRRRNYFLRFAYVVLLSIFILSIWYSNLGIRSSGSAVYQISRLSSAGRQIITTIVWFQFIVAQLIAIVMLSSSVSDEIHTGTLSVLMTTPISSFQIVTGKLLSKLLQLMLLLAISLPLLAIVRVFGGVPWDYVSSSVCITLTAALLAGTLSLLLSMTYRHAYTVILVTVIIYMMLFGALPGLFNMLAVNGMFIFDRQATQSLLALTNPFVAFAASNATFIQSGVPSFFSWPLHCLLMLAITAVLVTVAVWRVRKAAPAKMFSSAAKPWSAGILERTLTRIFYKAGSQSPDSSIIPVTGQPVIWREMRKGFIGQSKGEAVICILLIGAFLIAAVLLLLSSPRNSFLPRYFMSAFYLVALVRMAVFSAGSITAEKEARTWPVLLATPLEDRDIVRGKAIAAFRRNVPLLLLYFILFSISHFKMAGIENFPILLLSIALNLLPIASSALFIIGSGLYFGTRLRTTTTAVAATIGLHLAIAYLFCGVFNPLNRFLYMAAFSRRGQWLYFAMTIVRTLTIGGAGLAFARCARRRVRRDIF